MSIDFRKLYKSLYFWIVIVSFVWACLLCRAFTPIESIRETYIDSMMWITMARRVLAGDVLYRDIWDSKGPWIFLVNVLGLWLHPRYGLFFIEYLHMTVTSIFIFKISKLYASDKQAFWITLFWPLFCVSVLSCYGNTCSEYCLPWISAAVYGMCLWVKQEYHGQHAYSWAFVYGLAVGCCLMTRPSNALCVLINVVLILLVLLYYRSFRNAAINLLYGTLGIVAFCLPFVLYCVVNGVFYDMLYATFIYNFKYSAALSISFSISTFSLAVLQCSFYSVFGSLFLIERFFKNKVSCDLIFVISYVICIAYLCCTPGFLHYFIVLIPWFIIFTCICLTSRLVFVLCFVFNLVFGSIFIGYYFCGTSYSFNYNQNDIIDDYVGFSDELLIINSGPGVSYLNRPDLPDTRWILFQDFVADIDNSLIDSMRSDFEQHLPDYVYYGVSKVDNIDERFDICIYRDTILSNYRLLYKDTTCIIFERNDLV